MRNYNAALKNYQNQTGLLQHKGLGWLKNIKLDKIQQVLISASIKNIYSHSTDSSQAL